MQTKLHERHFLSNIERGFAKKFQLHLPVGVLDPSSLKLIYSFSKNPILFVAFSVIFDNFYSVKNGQSIPKHKNYRFPKIAGSDRANTSEFQFNWCFIYSLVSERISKSQYFDIKCQCFD